MKRSLLATALLIPLAGCAGQHSDGTDQGQAPLGRDGGNPASNYCVGQGGRLEIRQHQDGQVGYCHLPDGTVIEEWKLFRQAHAENS